MVGAFCGGVRGSAGAGHAGGRKGSFAQRIVRALTDAASREGFLLASRCLDSAFVGDLCLLSLRSDL